MNSNVHAILSDLHRLLSEYEREDFLRASRYHGIGHPLKMALRALAMDAPRERETNSEQFTPRYKPAQSDDEPVRQRSARSVSRSDQPTLVASILDSNVGKSISSLREFASNRGLKLDVRNKESREKFANRMAKSLASLPESKRNQVLSDLLGGVSNQTQGWINVIRGPRA